MNRRTHISWPAPLAGRFSYALRSSLRPKRTFHFTFLSFLAGSVFLLACCVAFYRIQAASSAAVQGTVLEKATHSPVENARVEIMGLDLVTSTDSRGRFSWGSIPLGEEMLVATVIVTSEGYGSWTIEGVRLIRDETLILDVQLTESPQTITVPPLSSERPAGFAADTEMNLMLSMIGGAEDIAIPPTVRVRVTGLAYCNLSAPYTVETIDFKDYVKHVLPNEWIPSWPWESLRSGAMAAKMYAWYWIALGGKWDDADVYDSTCDQVYNPAVSYASTNQAVEDTWNWRLTRNDQLIQTQYRAYESQCGSADCMGQWDSRDLALSGWTWDEILFSFYDNTVLTEVWDPPGGYSLRFDGVYNDEENRVLIAVDDPADSDPGPPVDIGASDITLEFWLKARPGENAAPAVTCGANQVWINGNMLFDRDRFGADRDYGLSLAGGRLVFGVSGAGTGDLTICGTTNLADSSWHHVAVQRRASDGWMSLYVDGVLQAEGDGPDGDISYPDDYAPPSTCGPSGTASCVPFDPNLAIGSEKHRKVTTSPSFKGWLDEIRFSNVLRYSGDFTRPDLPFTTDANTVALYHFDEGVGNLINDTSGAAGGPSNGDRIYGGSINGPEWSFDT
ncbi:MAG: LamG-like jellyroll fold domain-containing protein, partial [Anaerolineales bacterium]